MADNKQKKEHDVTTTTSGWQKQHTNGTQTTDQTTTQSGIQTSSQASQQNSVSKSEWTPEAMQAADDAAGKAYAAYGYKRNPETGALEKDPSLFDALGIDREKLRGERERQMKLNRWKQIESALYNSGAILTDMISAGIGGNVWKRDKDTTAADAAKDTERLRELQAAEDAAAAEKERQARIDAYKAGEEVRRAELERLKQSVQEGTSNSLGSSMNTTIGNTHSSTTTTTDTKTTSGQTQHQDYSQKYWDNHSKSSRTSSSGSGGGSSKSDNTLNIRVKRGANGNEILQFDMNASDKAALANSLSQAIAKRCATDENYRKELQQAGIIEEKQYKVKDRRGNEDLKSVWSVKDPVALLDDGNALEIPELMNIYLDYVTPNTTTNSRSKAYETITGEDLPRTSAGKVTQQAAQELARKGIVLPANECDDGSAGMFQ